MVGSKSSGSCDHHRREDTPFNPSLRWAAAQHRAHSLIIKNIFFLKKDQIPARRQESFDAKCPSSSPRCRPLAAAAAAAQGARKERVPSLTRDPTPRGAMAIPAASSSYCPSFPATFVAATWARPRRGGSLCQVAAGGRHGPTPANWMETALQPLPAAVDRRR